MVIGRITAICDRARQVLLVFAAPVVGVAGRQRHRRVHLLARVGDRAGEIAALDAELDADEARVRLAVDERRALAHLDVGELAERQVLVVRRRDQDVLDRLHVLPIRLLQPDDQIERSLALDHLRRRRAADRGLDQRVDVGDVEAVARDLRAVGLDRQARLAELAHERDVGDAGHRRRSRAAPPRPWTRAWSRSEPKIFTASELLSPVSASSTASSAGWV